MPSETLSLFPSPSSSLAPKSCLKQPNRTARTPSPVGDSPVVTKSEGLRGLALQFTPHQAKNIVVAPAQAHIKHSLFCDSELPRSDSPMAAVESGNAGPRPSTVLPDAAPISQPSNVHTRSPVPNGSGSPRSPSRHPSPRSVRPGSPPIHSRQSNATRRSPPPLPQRSFSQDQVRSIFPVYDHNLPLSQQHYYPSPDTLAAPPEPTGRRRSTSSTRPSLRLATSGTVSAREPQIAKFSQLQSLWSAATGASQVSRVSKIRLAMHREAIAYSNNESALEIGFSNFYSFTRKSITPIRPEDPSAEMLARRHHPLKDIAVPIAQVELAQTRTFEDGNHEPLATTIFPQTAALAALESAASSSQAVSIARFDPDASSPQAAQLAFDAVAQAKQSEQCKLLCTPETNPFGALSNNYELRHPRLGRFGITVKGQINLLGKSRPSQRSTAGRVARASYEKIILHHPYASVDRTTHLAPEVASLDITAGVLELDVAALSALDSAYILDSAVCALVAVALMESENVALQHGGGVKPGASFDAPPENSKRGRGGRASVGSAGNKASRIVSWKNGFRRADTEKPLPPPPSSSSASASRSQEMKLPGVTRALLKLIGFSFRAIVWLLGLGVKVLGKLLVSIGRAAK